MLRRMVLLLTVVVLRDDVAIRLFKRWLRWRWWWRGRGGRRRRPLREKRESKDKLTLFFKRSVMLLRKGNTSYMQIFICINLSSVQKLNWKVKIVETMKTWTKTKTKSNNNNSVDSVLIFVLFIALFSFQLEIIFKSVQCNALTRSRTVAVCYPTKRFDIYFRFTLNCR